MVKIGILKTDTVRDELLDEFGDYPQMFIDLLSAEDATLDFAVYDVQKDEYPAAIDDVDAYLITGSRFSVYDNEAWIAQLMDFVRELDRRRKKLIGICFGHQLVAQALGGQVEKSDKGWGVGLQKYRFGELPPWHDSGDEEFQILASHQDQVVTLASDTQVLAESAFCEYAVCQIGEHILTFQGHPEFVTAYSRSLIEARVDVHDEETYQQGLASLAEAPQQGRVARWMLNFLRG